MNCVCADVLAVARAKSRPQALRIRLVLTRFGWANRSHEENQLRSLGGDTSAGYAEVPGELVNKQTPVRPGGIYGGSAGIRHQIRGATP